MRYERKYRIDNLSPRLIIQGLMLHPASLRVLHPPRQINNIYFDTPDLSAYKENVMGVNYRRKYRVRWYGEQMRMVSDPKLEVKIRDNEVGSKLAFDIPVFNLVSLNRLTHDVNALCQLNKTLRPVLMNSYMRHYFTSPDHKFRLTLDYNLQYTSMLSSNIFWKHTFFDEQSSILELKYDTELDGLADRITQFLPYRRTKNSKYVTGVELCY